MGKKDPRVDQYINKANDFAKPILTHIRKVVHSACPEVEEDLKWGSPTFMYKGIMCGMAAFKEHAVFGFWKASLMKDPILVENARSEVAMGHLGRISSKKDLPADKTITAWIKEAMQLNDLGIKIEAKAKTAEKKEVVVPEYFMKALGKNKKALQVFENYAYSHKKEYVEWITEAKTEETRNKRMATALEWIAEGKSRHWKYAAK